jgi:hypothetical protein
VSRGHARPGCLDLAFREAYPLTEAAEVALEDYARALLRGDAAEAVPTAEEPARVGGVHVCGLAEPASAAALADLEDFAREMATAGGGGLGWS